MTEARLFVDARLAAGAVVAATPGQAHQLGAVLRRSVGDAVRLFNGVDGEWRATIAALRRDRATFAVGEALRAQAAEPELRLVLAALKRDAMEWAVEKATELGVASLQPVFTRRSVVDRINLDRLAAIAREAAEQCERLTLPQIAPARPLHAALDAWDGAPLLVAAERAEATPLMLALRPPPVGLLIGPEGGFERVELDDLRRRRFVSLVGLGPRILRAETAALAGLALLGAPGAPAP